jgi:hypothetical protein
MTKKSLERSLCFHCGRTSDLTMRARLSGMRIQLCEHCWAPLFKLISDFQPARPVL